MKQAGFALVEVLLAATILGFMATAIAGALVYGRESTADAGNTLRANYIAEEGIEATRNIGAAAYANLADGTFGLSNSGGTWVFSGTSDTTDIFTRTITIATASTNRKTITSTVTWTLAGGGSVSHTARITNWAAATKVWTNAVVAGGSNNTGTSDGLKVKVVGNYAYMVENISGAANFFILDISTASAPVVKGSLTLAGTPTNIAIQGNYAYITNQQDTGELQVVDITSPTAPVYKTLFDLVGTGNGTAVAVSGSYAYVTRISDATTNANEFTVVNISNPLVPTLAGGYNNNINMNAIYLNGSYAYVATSSTTTELLVVAIYVPATPTLAGSFNAATAVAATAVSGYGTTVFLGMTTTFASVSIASPAGPTAISTFTAAGTINDIDVDITQKFAYLATTSTTGEVQVVNVGTPASMTLAKTVDVSGTTSTANGIAYAPTLDIAVAATASDTQELVSVTRN
ncbi:MAG TPA: hypothetical protein VLF62_00475 [Candidatus Saccharimonadales bacterium]|nr:hypothetical protein [Candidatus Saccharimonadales bacterium]